MLLTTGTSTSAVNPSVVEVTGSGIEGVNDTEVVVVGLMFGEGGVLELVTGGTTVLVGKVTEDSVFDMMCAERKTK